MSLVKLTSKDQIRVGTYLKIIPVNGQNNYSYEKISVKFIVNNGLGTEIIIDREKNHYFNLDFFLEGNSSWVKEVFIYRDDTDKEAKLMLGKRGQNFRNIKGFFENDWNCERAEPEGFQACREVGGSYRCEYCFALDEFNEQLPIVTLKRMKDATEVAYHYLMDQDWKCEKKCGCELCDAKKSANKLLSYKSISKL